MTFRNLTRRHRFLRSTLLAAAYGATFVAGLAALLLPPRTISTTDIAWVTWIWASLALIGGLVGAWAVATDDPRKGRERWRLERWAAPLAIGGAFGYALGVWAAVLDTPTRLTQGAWVVVALLLLSDRAVEVAASASADRTARTFSTRLRR